MSLLSLLTRTPTPRAIEHVPVTIATEPSEEYQLLAAKLGIVTARPISATLAEILSNELIHIYPMNSVFRYMKSITPNGKIWVWKPCRTKDIERSQFQITFSQNGDGTFVEEVYDKAIPLPVLMTIDKIEEATQNLPAKPAFFVSDYAVRMPDPFLMVTIPTRGESQFMDPDGTGRLWRANPEPACFVIERWDEPSFR